MKNFYFTYGRNHEDKDGISLGNSYTEVKAVDEDKAREKMVEARGLKWAFSYPKDQKHSAVDRWNLTHKTLAEVTLLLADNYLLKSTGGKQ